MPAIRVRSSNLDPTKRAGSSAGTNTTKSESWAPSQANNLSANIAKQSNNPDAAKYVTAVQMAKDKFKDDPDVNKSIFRNAVDDIYNSIKDENDKSAAELRNENPLQQFGRFIGDSINAINNGIGGALDWVVDNPIAGAWDIITGGQGQAIRDAFSGEDLAIVPDLLEDVALGALGPVGIGLGVAKNLAQHTDDISEAITGRDSVTQEKIGLDRQLGKAGETLLSTALSAIPGVGKTASKGINSVVKKQSDAAVKAVDDYIKKPEIAKQLNDEAEKILNRVDNAGDDIVVRPYNPADIGFNPSWKLPNNLGQNTARAISDNGKEVDLVRQIVGDTAAGEKISPDVIAAANQRVSARQSAREALNKERDQALKKQAEADKLLNDAKNGNLKEAISNAYAPPEKVGRFQQAMNRIAGYDPAARQREFDVLKTKTARDKFMDEAQEISDIENGSLIQKIRGIDSPSDILRIAKNSALEDLQATPRNIANWSLPLADTYAAALGTYGINPEEAEGGPLPFIFSPMNQMVDQSGIALPITIPLLTAGTRKLTNAIMPGVGKAAAVLPQKTKSKNKPRRERTKEEKGKKVKVDVQRPMIRSGFLADLPFQAARAQAAGNLVNRIGSGSEVENPEMSDEEFISRLRAVGGVQ